MDTCTTTRVQANTGGAGWVWVQEAVSDVKLKCCSCRGESKTNKKNENSRRVKRRIQLLRWGPSRRLHDGTQDAYSVRAEGMAS